MMLSIGISSYRMGDEQYEEAYMYFGWFQRFSKL